MTTTVNLRKLLDRKQPELVGSAPAATVAGAFISSSRLFRQIQYYLNSATSAFTYLPEEDGWLEMPSPALGGTFAAGACGTTTPYSVGYITTPTQVGAPLQATASGAGSTTTIVTVNNYGVNALVGYQVRCISGTAANVGQIRAIVSNTATTITTTAFSSATANGDQFALEPIMAVTAGAGSSTTLISTIGFVNDVAIATVGNLVASSLIGYQIKCVETSLASVANQGVVRYVTANTTDSVTVGSAFPASIVSGDRFVLEPFATVTATGAGTTTTVVTTQAWPINQFSGYQLRCLTGTAGNIGLVRHILSNTATTITLQSALPSATAASDTFVVEPIVFAQQLTYSGIATTGGSSTSIPVSGTPWVVGQWADAYQVRITAGVNAGCVRTISGNSTSALTVAPPLPATPTATTQFIIEPIIRYCHASSIATNLMLQRDMRGFKIRVQTSSNSVEERTIVANTVGRNSVITVDPPFDMVPVPNSNVNTTTIAASGAGSTTTTIVTTNSWPVNAFVGYQVRALSGTAGNIGLVRTVVSNTATTLTLSVALPSATATSDKFELNLVQAPSMSSITASSAGTKTTIVTSNSWTVNEHAGNAVCCVSGTSKNVGVMRMIASNTATTLTLSLAFPEDVASADVFELIDYRGKSITSSGAGTTTTVVTAQNWSVGQYVGWQVRCLSGTAGNVGLVRRIISNTATTLTTTAFPSATSTSDVFVIEKTVSQYNATSLQLVASRWWVFNAHTAAPVANQFRFYDYALNSWFSTAGFSAATVGGVPPVGAAWGTDGRLCATPSMADNASTVFETNNVVSATATTVTCGDRNYAVNQWANYQIRIVSGTGAGQTRAITSNTVNTLSVLTWNIIPDSTSVFAIEGNDDNLYLLGNGVVAMYKFSISSGAWTLLSPITARAGAPGTVVSAHWAWTTSEPTWADPNNIISGRRIYSMRGQGGSGLDYYDIAFNTWVPVVYAPAAALPATGTKYSILQGRYLIISFNSNNRLYRLDFVKSEMDPFASWFYTQGTAILGDTMFDVTFNDGDTSLIWIYQLLNTSSIMTRMLVF